MQAMREREENYLRLVGWMEFFDEKKKMRRNSLKLLIENSSELLQEAFWAAYVFLINMSYVDATASTVCYFSFL